MREIRGIVVGFVLGGLLLGAAGVGLTGTPSGIDVVERTVRDPIALPDVTAAGQVPDGTQLPPGAFLAGTAKVSIAPDPEIWIPDVPQGTCPGAGEGCLITFDGRYAKEVREYGVWVRTFAISNGADTILLSVLDTIGWFFHYPDDICGDCGAHAIRESVGAELEVAPSNIAIAATHTHASGDTLSDIPTWYYEQVRDAIKESKREAFSSMQPAVIDVGISNSRWTSRDRRIVTRAVPDNDVQWLHATHAQTGETIGVLYNYAVHPTVLASNDTLHSGLAGAASDRLETELGGGVAMFFPSGLGNRTVVRGRGIDGLGHALADVVLADIVERPRRLLSNDIVADMNDIAIPGDNLVLLGARAADIFVRDILPPAGGGPMAGRWGKNERTPSCVGGGPLTVNTVIGGLKLGEAAIMLVPGEIFSTISLVTKDYLEHATVVFVLGLANDQLGYMIPYEEFDEVAQKGPGILANSSGIGQYEEVLSLGRCVGEQVMDELIASGRRLGFAS